jgi:hypothetical protein
MLVNTAPKQVIYPGCTQAVRITNMQITTTTPPTFWDGSASIQCTLVDSLGNPVAGCIAITFTYVPGSNGDFVAVFGDVNFQPEVGSDYTLIIDGQQDSSTYHAELLVEVRANLGQ